MRPLAVGALVVVAILIGFGGGSLWRSQQGSTQDVALQAELADVKSKMGIEVQTLGNEVQRLTAALEECERRLKEEQAQRKILEESLKKARVLK
jgi:uncharacterized protein HemX